jgi:hypothetical protein
LATEALFYHLCIPVYGDIVPRVWTEFLSILFNHPVLLGRFIDPKILLSSVSELQASSLADYATMNNTIQALNNIASGLHIASTGSNSSVA